MKKCTLDDIAKAAHVSKSVVSKAFSFASDINEKTRRDVLVVAEKLGYAPTRHKKQPRIAFLVQNTDYQNESDFGLLVLNSFRLAAVASGYEVILMNFDSDKNTQLSFKSIMQRHAITGAFFVGLDSEHIYLEELKKTDFPTVALDNFVDNPRTTGIGTDNIEGMRLATQHLIDLGHKRIAFLNGNPCSAVSYERLKGFILAHGLNNIPYDNSLVLFSDYVFDIPITDAEFVLKSGATAVVCGCDRVAIGLISRLKNMGKSVPKELSIVGYDNIQFSQYISPQLTTIHQDREAIGIAAFNALKDILEGRDGVKILIHPKLIIRESAIKI